MNIHYYWRPAVLMLALVASGCADYQYTVNDKIVYTPLPLFSDYSIADSALNDCVGQIIEDQKVTRSEELESLSCSYAGITELEGVEVFSNLQAVNLQHNDITSIQILGQLPQLQQLDLSHNALTAAGGLVSLDRLRQLDLSHNPKLDCDSVDSKLRGLELTLPQHCR
jgi:Leucine-rich repeat (LRR) protein